MTSSLVGSEMCIRDRVGWSGVVWSGLVWFGLLWSRLVWCVCGVAWRGVPVSYTHLTLPTICSV
eukprot:2428307-Prorocentrum_lima.AAC.1